MFQMIGHIVDPVLGQGMGADKFALPVGGQHFLSSQFLKKLKHATD